MKIFARLPQDIQRYIRTFFHIWERWGYKEKQFHIAKDGNLYYTTIRRLPRNIYWDGYWPFEFHFRRQRNFFQYVVELTSESHDHINGVVIDFWAIQIFPQWEKDSTRRIQHIFRNRVYKKIPYPAEFIQGSMRPVLSFLSLVLEFKVCKPTIQTTPTRQEMVLKFIDYVKRLAHVIESTTLTKPMS